MRPPAGEFPHYGRRLRRVARADALRRWRPGPCWFSAHVVRRASPPRMPLPSGCIRPGASWSGRYAGSCAGCPRAAWPGPPAREEGRVGGGRAGGRKWACGPGQDGVAIEQHRQPDDGVRACLKPVSTASTAVVDASHRRCGHVAVTHRSPHLSRGDPCDPSTAPGGCAAPSLRRTECGPDPPAHAVRLSGGPERCVRRRW